MFEEKPPKLIMVYLFKNRPVVLPSSQTIFSTNSSSETYSHKFLKPLALLSQGKKISF